MAKRTIDKVNIENLKELKPGEGIQVDSETKYDTVGEFEAKSEPILDPGTGQEVLIRLFEFAMNPAIKDFPTDRQLLFNAHAKQIANTLWGDGLRPFDGAGPRVIIDAKKKIYRIFVPCEARTGLVFNKKATTLTKELAKSNTQANESTRHS